MVYLGDGSRGIMRIFVEVRMVRTSWEFKKSYGVSGFIDTGSHSEIRGMQ